MIAAEEWIPTVRELLAGVEPEKKRILAMTVQAVDTVPSADRALAVEAWRETAPRLPSPMKEQMIFSAQLAEHPGFLAAFQSVLAEELGPQEMASAKALGSVWLMLGGYTV